MMHEISEQNWEAYLEDQLAADERDRMEAHMLGCLTCWELYEQLKLTSQQLHEAGAEARRNLALSDEELHRGLRGVFARISSRRKPSASVNYSPLQERLNHLEAALATMCGSRTAANALQAAAQIAAVRSPEQVTPDNWEPFLDSLTSIATVMCGETGVHLIREGGRMHPE